MKTKREEIEDILDSFKIGDILTGVRDFSSEESFCKTTRYNDTASSSYHRWLTKECTVRVDRKESMMIYIKVLSHKNPKHQNLVGETISTRPDWLENILKFKIIRK